MGLRTSIGLLFSTAAVTVVLVMASPHTVFSQTSAPPKDTVSFFHGLSGEWIGTVDQYTGQVKADTKYFHAVIKQTSPNTYAAAFVYFRLDPRTHSPMQVGVADMTNILNPDGTVTNTMNGNGDVFIDPKTSKHEEHQLSEVLRMSASGGLEGRGSGKISVDGMAMGAGKNGKVSDYTSAWAMDNGALRISERLKATFRVLFFSKRYDIVDNFEARRGTDVAELMRGDERSATSNSR